MRGEALAALVEEGALAFFPSRQRGGVGLGKKRAELSNALLDGRDLVGAQNGFRRDVRARIDSRVAIQTAVAQGVKEREDLEVILLGDGIELVVVALGARQSEPQHGFAQGFDPVRVVVGEVLRGQCAALVGDHVVALETGGDELGLGASRQKIPGQLFREEPVVRHVVVERLNHPVPPQPHVPTAID